MDKKGVWRVKYITIIHHLINETRSYHLRSSYSDITYSVMKALASWDIFGINVRDRGGTKQRHLTINLSPFIMNSVTCNNGQQVLKRFHTTNRATQTREVPRLCTPTVPTQIGKPTRIFTQRITRKTHRIYRSEIFEPCAPGQLPAIGWNTTEAPY